MWFSFKLLVDLVVNQEQYLRGVIELTNTVILSFYPVSDLGLRIPTADARRHDRLPQGLRAVSS